MLFESTGDDTVTLYTFNIPLAPPIAKNLLLGLNLAIQVGFPFFVPFLSVY